MRDSVLIRYLENTTYKKQQMLEFVVKQCNILSESEPSPQLLSETVDSLKQTIRKLLLTNKVIPEPLALTIAKVFAFTKELELELTKKKTPELQKHLKMIFDVAAHITQQQLEPAATSDSTKIDLVANIKTVLGHLTGNPEEKLSVEQTFNRILDKIDARATNGALPVDVMKLSSHIIQSNGDANKRKSILDTIV
jgi:hypothetical protein